MIWVDYQIFTFCVPKVDGVENEESMWKHSPKIGECKFCRSQDSASVLFKQILHFNFLLNYSAMLAIRHPIGCNHREMNGLLGRKRCF